ncbi:MAG: heparinase II/III family protein [Planctomycetota bacterium]|jgi:hypothetical protein|nr:heparinase II/III family protein [Planctomycetota bacterium]
MSKIAKDFTKEITEEDFWSSLRAKKGIDPDGTVQEAIELGLASHKARAYAKLAEFHRRARALSWQMAQEDAEIADRPTRAEVRKLIRKPLSILSSSELSELVSGKHDVADLQILMGHVQPVLNYVIHTGDKEPRRFLAQVLTSCYRCREALSQNGDYPLHTMLPAHAQFHFFWRIYLAQLHTGNISTDAAEAAMKLILGIGRAMRQATRRYIVHNIFTAGCFGLFFLSRTMKEFRESNAWERQSLRWLDLDFDRSFFPDGGHLERNWGYGAFTLERLTQVWEFAQRTGGMAGRGEHFLAGLRRAYQFFALTLSPDDMPPGFGDSSLLSLGYVLDLALDRKVFPPGTARDLGVERSRSCFMKGSGVAIMRNGAQRKSTFANVSFGDYAGWHSHMDLLSTNLWSRGEILIEEVPRFGPYGHPMDILWRAPEAHNQLLVDTFLYDSRPCEGQDVAWHSDGQVDFFSAYHNAYRQVPPQGHRDYKLSADLIVRRTVVFVKNPGYMLVMDSVRHEQTGMFNRATSAYWHSPQAFRVLGPGLARTTGRKACLLAWAYPDSIRRIEPGIDFKPEDVPDGHAPPKNEWHHLRARTWMDADHPGCLGFITILLPFEGKIPNVSVRAMGLPDRVCYRFEALEVTTPAGRDRFVLNPERLPDVSWRGRPVTCRAKARLSGMRRWLDVE